MRAVPYLFSFLILTVSWPGGAASSGADTTTATVRPQPSNGAPGAFTCQSAASARLSAQERQSVIGAVQKRYLGVSGFQGKFTQYSYLAALEATETSSGTVAFRRPGMMRWDYTSPEKQQFLLKGDTVWFYQPELNQVLIDSAKDALLTDLPVTFLLGIGDLQKSFKVTAGCRVSEKRTLLTLAPSDARSQKQLSQFELLIESASSLPVGARVVDASGNSTAISFDTISTDRVPPEGSFSVKYPPGTDLNDRRALRATEQTNTEEEENLHG